MRPMRPAARPQSAGCETTPPVAPKSLHISLKAGQRIYINGALLKADRRVALELFNDASFLLDSHVLDISDATTPLRRLYFAIQGLLTEPSVARDADAVWRRPLGDLIRACEGTPLRCGLEAVSQEMAAGRIYEALRGLRRLFPLEAELLAASSA